MAKCSVCGTKVSFEGAICSECAERRANTPQDERVEHAKTTSKQPKGVLASASTVLLGIGLIVAGKALLDYGLSGGS
jgi:hypothetical protein